jgi:hypothetical protein
MGLIAAKSVETVPDPSEPLRLPDTENAVVVENVTVKVSSRVPLL